MAEHICKITKLLSMGELYDRVRHIQHQGLAPPYFARIANVPYYGIAKNCPTDCKSLHDSDLCNNQEVIEKFIKDNYPIRCKYIK